ncbi:MAG TPA: zf-HC2 domain-containing protein [Edaphobacter sp.]|jgi:anti-sigma factor RsiW|nr:zf-HC2 domain-containing protein [Edaphobacter sp.]
MSDHLSPATLNALADGELAADELASVTEHLHGCSACTSHALEQSLLKSATARAGKRYALPDDMRERMERLVLSQNASNRVVEERTPSLRLPTNRPVRWVDWAGWAVAATLLVSAGGLTVVEVNGRRAQTAAVERAALVTEVGDQHIATLAANLPPQVLSSDRHTVKPWFQGKIPFSFNLPEGLPEDTKLEGANLVYLHNRPVAQLLYDIGRHRVSVFVQQRTAGAEWSAPIAEHVGFRLAGFSTNELDVVAISDVDPVKLTGLIALIKRAQLE